MDFRSSAALVFLLTLSLTFPAAAQSTDSVEARQAFIDAALAEEQPKMQLWWDGWMVFFALALPTSAGLMTSASSDAQRQGYIASTATAAIGVVAHALSPTLAADAVEAVRRFEGTPEEKLAYSEKLLRKSARREAFMSGVFAHVGGLVVSGTAAGILWLKYDQPSLALRNLLVGTAIGQLRIYTLPTGHVDAAEAYESRFGRGPRAAHPPQLFLTPGGLSLVGEF